MQLDQMFLQLGVAGAVLLIGYRLAMRWITVQREQERERTKMYAEAEAARTKAWIDAERERTQTIREGFAADIAAHNMIATAVGALDKAFARVEGKIDVFFELTPVREQLAIHEIRERAQPKVIVDPSVADEDEHTPVDRPTPPPSERPFEKRTSTPNKGVPTQPTIYGPHVRPKTSG